MRNAQEGFERQNVRFMKLYHECLSQFKVEVREKKNILNDTKLAFMTAEPGLLN